MKRFLSLFVLSLLLLTSCNKEETKLEAFNPEAFAYDLGNTWEVNATINVKGFEQREGSGDTFEASISYSADIKTPNGKTVENLYSDKINISAQEEIIDIPLEVQFELDSTYSFGKYTIIFNITDIYSQNSITGSAEFDLTE
ncbi:MAG: hypothetical protein IH795_08795 [Bacteroidetes bacterium]|nr:hypothetical protein [Bacteroidota bacterium]